MSNLYRLADQKARLRAYALATGRDVAEMRAVVLSGNLVAGAEHDKATVGAHRRSEGDANGQVISFSSAREINSDRLSLLFFA